MPNLNGHIAIAGAATGAVFYFGLIPMNYLSPMVGLGVLIGTILPDLDHQSSTVNQRLLLINKKWFQILIYSAAAFAVIYTVGLNAKGVIGASTIFLTALMPHRGFTHKPIGVILISTTLFLFLGKTPIAAAIVAGMLVHILADKIKDYLF